MTVHPDDESFNADVASGSIVRRIPGDTWVLDRASSRPIDGVTVLLGPKGVGRWIRHDQLGAGFVAAHGTMIIDPVGTMWTLDRTSALARDRAAARLAGGGEIITLQSGSGRWINQQDYTASMALVKLPPWRLPLETAMAVMPKSRMRMGLRFV